MSNGGKRKAESSDDSDSSEDEGTKSATTLKPAAKTVKKASSDSEEDRFTEEKKQSNNQVGQKRKMNDQPVQSSPPAKKVNPYSNFVKSSEQLDLSKNNKIETPPNTTNFKHQNGSGSSGFGSGHKSFTNSDEKRGVNRFRRVREEDIDIDERLMDNSYEAKQNAHGAFGERANRILKHTKGKSFRHEKTKKKRAGYQGGFIDTSVNSIKFDN
uniref:SRP40_C domain-containing protein n=1 Tax=Anopheles funestus TaxID=62324 RepID=A0A4Y0BFL1_ANOFN